MTARTPLAVLALALAIAGCGGGDHSGPGTAGPRTTAVPQLTSLGQLKSAFNKHAGEPRLIVLLSPT